MKANVILVPQKGFTGFVIVLRPADQTQFC